jgi:Ca2+-binding RTX toxin-like protein
MDYVGGIEMVVAIGQPGRDTLRGGTGNDVLVGLGGDDFLFGQGGQDTLMGNQNTDVVLGEAGNDILSGGEGNDILAGNEDDDALNGGVGNDNMQGGPGNDRYVVDAREDVVDEGFGANEDPADLVSSFINYTLPERIENLTLLGTAREGRGNDNLNRIVGNSSDNIFVGRQEIDFSGTHRGDRDTLIGQDGNDIYIIDSEGDRVIEAANQGNDFVATDTLFYQLPDNVENLILVGPFVPLQATSGFGNELNNEIHGSQANNLLVGLEGDDTIYGGSGGSDTMNGGEGNDEYVVYDPISDIVRESNPDGSDPDSIDEVTSFTAEYTLPDRVENLVLTDNVSTVVNGFGNSAANVIQGNQLNNLLDGGSNSDTLIGAQGDDILNGGDGDDTYLFHLGDGIDQVNADDGFDTVRFDNSIAQNQVAFFTKPFQQLEIGYTSNDTDLISTPVFFFGSQIERFELQNGLFMNSADITRLQSILSAYANAHGISMQSLNDVKNNPDLMAIINDAWRVGPNVPFTPFLLSSPPVVGATVGTTFDDTLIGSKVNDVILASGGADYVMGIGGDDFISGGSGNDILLGGAGNDTIFSRFGDDILNGGSGIDLLIGSAGSNTYIVDDSKDTVVDEVNGGFDIIYSLADYTLASNSPAESLRLIGINNIAGIGNLNNNEIIGNDGSNVLDGKSGVDTLQGGKGNDLYLVDNIEDRVIESVDQGDDDRMGSTVDYTLPEYVEGLSLEGTANINGTGNGLANLLLGNSGNNILTGAGGNDILYGSLGDDGLVGGIGDDCYVIFDDSGDAITELAGEGLDEVRSYVSYSLTENVENLILGTIIPEPLIDVEGANNINGFGNAENNYMEGNRGNNTLTGDGGNDYLVGAQGNDILSGDDNDDTYLFRLGDGIDHVNDVAGFHDTLRFNNSISQENIIFFRDPQNLEAGLQIGYVGSDDRITLDNQTSSVIAIERFELQDGLFMDAEDVNRIVAAMSQYAANNGISLTSLADVQNNPDLMNMVNSGWHT